MRLHSSRLIVDPATESISAVKMEGKIIVQGLERRLAVSSSSHSRARDPVIPIDIHHTYCSCGSG